MSDARVILLDNEQLVPAAWTHLLSGGPVRIFNPGLLADRGGWILAYRVVFEGDGLRRIAMCRLDESYRPVPDTAVPYSDRIRFSNPQAYPEQALTWHADPRLYRFGGRAYVYWNSGWHEPGNHQFVQEFDPGQLQPIGEPRELLLEARRKLEKNWGLFEANGAVYAVYNVDPYQILRVALVPDSGPIRCEPTGPAVANPRGFAQVHGGLRGGAPPQRHRDRFVGFCHAIENADDGYAYVAAAFEFAADPPFPVIAMPTKPLHFEIPAGGRRQHAKLNPAVGSVVYPSGAGRIDNGWAVSVGIDDERCGIALLSDCALAATLQQTG